MKIAIIGAGNVGGTLGKRFAEVGHEVSFGVTDPAKYTNADLPGPAGTVKEAAASAGLVVLAVPFNAVDDALNSAGDLSEKIVVDATNPLELTDGALRLSLGHNSSGGEKIATLANGARVVKCFNQTGFGIMAEPQGSMMFVCGTDESANETVRQLAEEIGFRSLVIGGIERSRLLEPLAMLWIHLSATTELNRDFAFHINKR